MENPQIDLLPEELFTGSRNKMIPGWIRFFSWIFHVVGAFAILGLLFGILGYKFSISLYGLDTQEPLSAVGMFLVLVFGFKAVVAYGFLKRTDAAITLGLIDAIAGIVICLSVMIFSIFWPDQQSAGFFRLELLVLVPYLLKLKKIKTKWENVVDA